MQCNAIKTGTFRAEKLQVSCREIETKGLRLIWLQDLSTDDCSVSGFSSETAYTPSNRAFVR